MGLVKKAMAEDKKKNYGEALKLYDKSFGYFEYSYESEYFFFILNYNFSSEVAY